MENKNMTENDIINFAFNFRNLINDKNNKINELKAEVRQLQEQLKAVNAELLEPDEIINRKRPVWVKTSNNGDFYALPISNGVISAKMGRYDIRKYRITWVAYSDRPAVDIDASGK